MNSLEQNFYFSSCMPRSSIFLSLLAFDCAPRVSANIRGALSNLKKTGIIADGRGMRVRKMKFCDKIRWQELHPICQTFPTNKKRTVYAAHLPQDVTQFFSLY
jgi:hypothetical protein